MKTNREEAIRKITERHELSYEEAESWLQLKLENLARKDMYLMNTGGEGLKMYQIEDEAWKMGLKFEELNDLLVVYEGREEW